MWLAVLEAWGFEYKTNLIWHKIRKDGGSDGRGVGFYFRNVTEVILFGIRGKGARTLQPGRRQVNLIAARKREHSAETGRAIRDHRSLLLGTVSGVVWERAAQRLEDVGASGHRRIRTGLADLRLQLGSGDGMNLAALLAASFDVASLNHAEAVMVRDFAGPLKELCDILTEMQILDAELIRGGGGEASLTQRLRQELTERGWKKAQDRHPEDRGWQGAFGDYP